MEVVLGTLELSWEISRHVIPVALICRPKLSITKVKLLLLYRTSNLPAIHPPYREGGY